MIYSGEHVSLDPRRRRVSVDGRSTELQEKTWQVLCIVAERTPETVTRATIIDEVWSGHFLTGDKGLNQAMWAIRTAIGDDARQPRFIRTIPRVGYQWIAGPVTKEQETRPPRYRKALAASLGVIALSTSLAIIGKSTVIAPVRSSIAPAISVADNGTRAYLQDRAIVVDMAAGCTRVVRADQADVEFGNPVVSTDGRHIVFPVRQGADCKIVTLELESGERNDYGSCSLLTT